MSIVDKPLTCDPYASLALGIINNAIEGVENYVKGISAATCKDAVISYQWLIGMNEGRLGLSLAFICDSLGLDHDAILEGIMKRWDFTDERLRCIVRIAEHYSPRNR